MQPDFSVLDAYFDLWQRVSLGERVSPAFVGGMIGFAPYQPSLDFYQTEYAISRSELARILLRLTKSDSGAERPELQAFWQANRHAVQRIGYCFDIIFPLRRLNLTHALHQAGLADEMVPHWLRIQPELAQMPYRAGDALILDFFSLQIDPGGHLTALGQPLVEYVVASLGLRHSEIRSDQRIPESR